MTVLTKLVVKKKQKAIEKFVDNQFQNILRLFDVLSNFPFTTSETMGYCLTSCGTT